MSKHPGPSKMNSAEATAEVIKSHEPIATDKDGTVE